MSESNLVARSDVDEEQVSGAEVIAQALKTQVRRTPHRRAPTEAGGGWRRCLGDEESGAVGGGRFSLRLSS